MSGQVSAEFRCPRCGYADPSNDDLAPNALLRPWHVMHGRAAVRAYVASLGAETDEWLLALYVDAELRLLGVDTVARGEIDSCPVPFWHLISRGKALGAQAFILVHNHPSGDPRPSTNDIRTTAKLARLSHDLDMPLLDHLIIAGDRMVSCGYF